MNQGPPARIDRTALERIIRRAAELQTAEGDVSDTLTSEELIAVGREVGIPARHLQQAILEERASLGRNDAPGLLQRVAGPADVSAQRVVSLEPDDAERRLVDWIEGGGAHEIVWRLHLTPGALKLCMVSPSETRLTLPGTPAIHFVVKHPEGVRVSPGESRISNAYGLAESRPMIEAAGLTRLPARISCTIRVEGRLAEQPT